jgi:hypothetical protein
LVLAYGLRQHPPLREAVALGGAVFLGVFSLLFALG